MKKLLLILYALFIATGNVYSQSWDLPTSRQNQ